MVQKARREPYAAVVELFAEDRKGAKRDRLARLGRILGLLSAHPDGMRPDDIAERVQMSKRSVYRDLKAIDAELGFKTWNVDGRWGLMADELLPDFKFTGSEAMAVFLAARLTARYADRYDPDLASAFEKLARGLPGPLAEHVDRTLDLLGTAPTDARHVDDVRLLTKAWASRRIVEFDYEPATYEGRARRARHAIVRPYLLEPSLETHALYLIGYDETRAALRTFKVERLRSLVVTPRTFEPPAAGTIEASLRRAWDIIADQPETDVVLRFAPAVAARVAETTWHPSQELDDEPDGALLWRGRVAGTTEIKLWVLSWGSDVEVLEPAALRDEIAAVLRAAAARYGA
jgi:predicted DNA-binding transcriptional regulator YafY